MMTAMCAPCAQGEHADDGTGTPCPCCGAEVSEHPCIQCGAEPAANGLSVCQICHEPIRALSAHTWTHKHGDVYCGTGDGSTAYPTE